MKGSIEMTGKMMNGKIVSAIVLGFLASTLFASTSEAQYQYIGGAPYYGYYSNTAYPVGSIMLYGAGMPYGVGTSGIGSFGGFLGASPYFGGLGNTYGYAPNNMDMINSLYGYPAPANYGTAATPAGGFGATPIEGVNATNPNVIVDAGDTGIAAVPSGVTPAAPAIAGSGGAARRGVYVVNGPTGLKDSIDITKPSSTQVKIAWRGNPSTIKQMTFSILDSTRHPIDSQDITAMPAQATFTKRRRSVYYRIFIQYLDGATRTLTAPL